MKLKVTDWRHAWFESHISDRFFQEMAKLEKGTVQGLEVSAQWMEQIVIETGALAQAMIRLEHNGAPEPQIKLAYEKALRLAALCMHLMTALDGADRVQLRSSSLMHNEPAERAISPSPSPLPAYPHPGALPSQPQPSAQGAPAAPPAEDAGATPIPGPNPAPDPGAPALHPLSRGPALLHPSPKPPEPEPVPAVPPVETDTAPLFSSLLQVSGRDMPHSESEMHQTIRSLSEQGLSRAEIEVVTGEPRHVIEAVLNHARSQSHAGTPPG